MPDQYRSRDSGLIERLSRLYTGVVADTLDKLGYRSQVLDRRIRPVWPEAAVAGRCHTVSARTVYEVPDSNRYDGEISAVESVTPGDVLVAVIQGPTLGSFWGELVSTAARVRGGVGTIVDGTVRDTKKIAEMKFPVFAAGRSPADALGRLDVEAHGVPIICGGVAIDPGDFVLADIDGIVAIPARTISEVLDGAEEKVGKENEFRSDLIEGKPLREVYERLGIL